MTNNDVILSFVKGKDAHTQHLYAIGDKLYNYYTCIAQRLDNGKYIMNNTKYSVTTSKIQSNVRWRIGGNYQSVTNVPLGAKDLVRYLPK